MKVSIIIPVYNVAPYIKRCLDSVAAQTYTSIKCILVDDCGTDDSIDIARQWIENYKGNIRFVIFHHPKNQGLSAARNTGIEVATGDYVYFLDSDDAITPDCIKTLADLANRYPNADFVQGNTFREAGQTIINWNEHALPKYSDNKTELTYFILQNACISACNKLIKREFIIRNSLYFPVSLIMEDHYWTWYLAKYVNAVAFSTKGTYFYALNANSTVNSIAKEMQIRRYTSYLKVAFSITSDMIGSGNSLRCQRMYAGEAFVFALENVARIHSFVHWWRFWAFICRSSWEWKRKFSWGRVLFLIGMLPPVCFLAVFRSWRWRFRQHVLSQI